MSHSENNMDRQVKRHKGPLLGFIAIVVFVGVLLVWWLGTVVDEAEDATGAQLPADGTSLSAPETGDGRTSAVPAQNPSAEGADDLTAPAAAD
ncbi:MULTISPECIES: hypothetical protein [unclassified Yoonia]|uniref:hypothetical protein n=1 Tax=unclassified Yoonia TaxID=2629118 RepID=UPI002AFE00A4|nr:MULTISPECIES: hypothetical protein [unclassified Yoonia]